MTRLFYLLFGVSAYFIFFASFLYLIAFVGDAPWVPFTINRGGADMGLFPAIVIDLGLVLLFGIQHSVMARPGFKQGWTKIVAPALERSIYVLVASLLLVLLFRFWVPITGTVWNVGHPAAATAILALFGFGWLTVLVSTSGITRKAARRLNRPFERRYSTSWYATRSIAGLSSRSGQFRT